MSSLSSVEAKLPPGFRFHPRDDELISDYLIKWAMGCGAHPLSPLLIQVDLNKCEPWDIPETARVGEKDRYFYSQRDRKYATGLRTNRATISGYWKATGKDRPVIRKGNLIGMRKTLVFYQGRAPKGRKTDWVMHEYRLEGKSFSLVKEDWVLCRVFLKNTSQVTPSSSPSLPPLMEPYNDNNITFADHTQADLYNEQVPCFSIFSTNQTSPTFTHMGPPEIITMPGDAHLGTCNNSSSLISNDLSSSAGSCDEKVIRDVLSQFTKMESASADESPSSDSYLGLSSIWNQYS